MEMKENTNEIFLDPEKLLDKLNILKTYPKIICKMCKGIVSTPIELYCGHIFCLHCLKNWEDQLNDKCPTCNKVMYKKSEISEEMSNILEKLNFSEKNKIFKYQEYVDFLNQEHKNVNANVNLNAGPLLDNKKIYKCKVCGTEYDDIIKKQINKYEERNKQLTEELRKIYEYKRKLQGDIYRNKYDTEMPKSTLIDKCKHFSGNYKPIFDCCNTAYGCYLCHDENECHQYQISQKVVCLLCACVYEGNECPNCKVKQCYQKKEN